MNYFIVAIMCILGLIIGSINITKNTLINLERKALFVILASLTIACIILDTIAFQLDGQIKLIPAYKGTKILEFILTPCIIILFAKIIAKKDFWEKIYRLYFALVVVNAIAQLGNLLLPVTFYITKEAKYTRTIFGYFYFINVTICIGLLIYSAQNAFVQGFIVHNYTVFAVAIIVLIGVAIRQFLPKCNSDWMAITMAYLTFSSLYMNETLKLDSTTYLLNRMTFDNNLYQMTKYNTAIIVIDANNFKQINDEFGHLTGDWALAKIAEAMLKIFNKFGYCFRIGGDEFAVILKPGIITKPRLDKIYPDRYQFCQDLCYSLDEELSRISQEIQFEISVSSGFGIYLTREDTPETQKYEPIENVFQIADNRMYEKKQKFKEMKSNQ